MHKTVQFITTVTAVVCWSAGNSLGLYTFNHTDLTNNTNKTQSRNFCIGYGLQFWAGCAEDTLNGGGGCLAGDGLVQLATGAYKTVSELQAGDRVLAMSEKNPEQIIETDIIMIMHRVTSEYAVFYVIETENRDTIRLTPGHFVPVLGKNGARYYLQAHQLTKDDYVFVQSKTKEKLVPSKIVSIRAEAELGYYSPLTTTGTLIVNKIGVSCYSNILSHEMAHLGMTPVRWIHALVGWLVPSMKVPFHDDNFNQIHWIPKMMQTMAQTLAPQILTK